MERELQLTELLKRFENYPDKYFLEYEREQLTPLLAKVHGYYLVQLGNVDCYDLKSVSTIMQRVYVGESVPDNPNNLCLVESKFSELPFQYESVDLFLLPHTLEFTKDPNRLLNEIYNILIPGGKIILMGFNPFSFLGLRRLLGLQGSQKWGKFYSLGQIKAWLRSNGFSMSYQKTFCFRPSLKNESILNKLFFLEPFGQFCYPHWGNVYVIAAEKRVASLTPMKIKVFSKKMRVSRGFPEPSTHKG